MKKKRVVVTGMGIVSCFGTDIDAFYNQLLVGKALDLVFIQCNEFIEICGEEIGLRRESSSQ